MCRMSRLCFPGNRFALWHYAFFIGLFCGELAFAEDHVQIVGMQLTRLEHALKTNCKAPEFPSAIGEKPRNIKAYNLYLQKSAEYRKCLSKFRRLLSADFRTTFSSTDNSETWQSRIIGLNSSNLWQPAPEKDLNTGEMLPGSIVAGDQARAVLGKIPVMQCDATDTVTIHVQVNGNQVRLLPNPAIDGRKQFAHINTQGDIVRWTETIERCDKPSLAGGVNECGTASRMTVRKNGNVTWVLLCRKSVNEFQPLQVGMRRTDFDTDREEPDSIENQRYEDYWAADNPFYSLVGLIGHNAETGETAYFDGSLKDWNSYRFDEPVYPPGGFGYQDKDVRAAELKKTISFYSNEFKFKCHTCHDNGNPWILTPYTNFSEVGYRNRIRRKRFSSRSFADLESAGHGIRVIGSEYIRRIDPDYTERDRTVPSRGFEILNSAKTFTTTDDCALCHKLTTQMTGRYFAYDSIGKRNYRPPPKSIYPAGTNEWHLQWEYLKNSRTKWASETGKIHPWMPLPYTDDYDIYFNDNKFIREPVTDWVYDKSYQEMKAHLDLCAHPELQDEPAESCQYEPLYSSCVSPGFEPDKAELIFERNAKDKGQLRWNYLNSYGGVSDRDDVRFTVEVERLPLQENYKNFLKGDLADEPVAKFRKPIDRYASIFSENKTNVIARVEHLTYAAQGYYADPEPAVKPRQYQLRIPEMQCGYRYISTVRARRYCFDGGPDMLSEKSAVAYLDIPCS